MTPSQIAGSWRTAFGEVMPAGFLCRQTYSERWVRVHSLPESKRYPENDAERAELLKRHNAVATATLGEATHCILFAAHFSENQNDFSAPSPLPGMLPFEHVLTLAGDEEHDDMQFYATEACWSNGAFDAVILARAEDAIGPILFANLDRGTAYAPYDGGADLILGSSDAVALAKKRWSQWLSSRDDGL